MFFIQAAAKRITDWIVQGGGISEKDREVYEFGLNNFLSTLTNFIIIACFGLLLGIFLQTIVFYLAYFMLRIYAGGYHADNPLVCFFVSIFILIPCLLAISFQELWNISVVFFVLLAVGIAVLIALAPVENKNKILDALEKVVYRRRLLRNLTIASLIAVALFVFSFYDYSAAILCGILLSAAIVVAGKVKLSLQGL